MEGIKSARVWCLVGVECDAGETRTSAYRAWGLKHARVTPIIQHSNTGERVVGGTRVCWVRYWWWHAWVTKLGLNGVGK